MSNFFDQFDTADAPGATAAPGPMNALLNAVRHVESRGNPNAVSPAGAKGPYQFMDKTAKAMGITNPFDEQQSRAGAEKYLTQLENKFGNRNLALLAYNWGPANVDSWLKTGKGIKGQPMPDEAQRYVGQVRQAEFLPPKGAAPAAGNFFDQFDGAPSKPTVKAPTRAETVKKASEMALEGMSGWEKALAGAGKTVADLGRTFGIGEDDADAKARDAALTSTGAGMTGNIVGDVAATLVPGTAVFKGVSALPKVVNWTKPAAVLGRNILAGGASGAATEAMLNRDAGEGAAFGAAIPVIGKAIAKGAGGVSNLLQSLKAGAEGRAVQEVQHALGDRAGAAVDALRSLRPAVEGEVLTAGKAATAQVPELAVWEKMAHNSPQAALFQQADEATNAARIQALRDVQYGGVRPVNKAGDITNSMWEQTRENITKPIYKAAMPDRVAISPDMERLLLGPDVSESFNAGMKNFNQAARNARAAGEPVPRAGRYVPDRQVGELTIDQLQRIRTALDKKIANSAMAPNRANLIEARQQIASLMSESSPRWKAANSAFAEHSQPQNQADIASSLIDIVQNPANDAVQRATPYMNALRDAPSLAKRSDLSPRFQTLEKVFQNDPAGLEKLRGVGESLSRDARVAGMNTNQGIVPKFMSPAERVEKTLPNLLTRPVTVLRTGLKYLTRQSDEAVQEIVNKAMVDPKAMADLIERLPPNKRSEFINSIRDIAGKVPATATVPATTVSGDISRSE